jgi:uncharacterized protein (DUF2062 family)
VVFKRRDRRSFVRVVREAFYPRGGWTRAFYYVRHRLRRLPDTPHKIARGIWAGVFASFTPFYGFHFITAALIALVLRGNVLASAIGTFFGNPLTYIPIGLVALETGHWILGTTFEADQRKTFARNFVDAGEDLWRNLMSVFTGDTPQWAGFLEFYRDVFVPYLVGGIVPGIVAATVCYYVTIPLVEAYQARRRAKLKKRLADRIAKAAQEAERRPDEVTEVGD